MRKICSLNPHLKAQTMGSQCVVLCCIQSTVIYFRMSFPEGLMCVQTYQTVFMSSYIL